MTALKELDTVDTFERGLTIEEFLAFCETRPDDERWELIEGMPVLSPTPVDFHQIVVQNISAVLVAHKLANRTFWTPLPGIGQRVPVSPRSLPAPDLMVKAGALNGTCVSDEALVLFEVLSPSNSRKDQAWRRKVYASAPGCAHYVTIGMKKPLVTCHDVATGWEPREMTGLGAVLDLPVLGLSIPLTTVYRWTPLAP